MTNDLIGNFQITIQDKAVQKTNQVFNTKQTYFD